MTASDIISRVFAGEIVVHRHQAWEQLAQEAERVLRAHLPGGPLTAHERLDSAAYLEAARLIRDQVKGSDLIRESLRAGLSAAGLDPEGTFRDRLILRAQPPAGIHSARETMQLPAHRDNWGSGIPQQINWWMPILPVSADRTLWLYPDLLRTKVANDSADWSFDTVLADVKAGRAELTTPKATRPIDPDLAHPLLLEPGEMALFSGAHLHQSAPNQGPHARFNFETRTVSLDHVQAGLGIVTPDGAPQGPWYRWFRHLSSGERMDLALTRMGH